MCICCRVRVIGNGYGVVLPACLIVRCVSNVCICCRIRVIGNGYGVVLPASCLCGDVFPMCVFVVGLGLLVMVME